MFKDRYAIRAAVGFLAIVMLLASGTAVYGFEGGSYHDFRDNQISLYLPEGWASEETDASEAEDSTCQKICTAWDDIGDTGLELSMYYVMDKAQTDDYFYIGSDEAAALEYYENYGRAAVERLYDQVLAWPVEDVDETQWSVTDPVYYGGQWNGFLVVTGSGSAHQVWGEKIAFDHTIYVTARMTDDGKYVVTSALVFQNELTEEQAQLAGEIADEFYDYDYYNVMAGIQPDDSLWGDEDDADFGGGMDTLVTIIIGIVGILAPLVIVAAVVVIVVKRVAKRTLGTSHSGWNSSRPQDKGAKSFSAGFTGMQQSLDLGDTINKFKKRQAEKNSFSGREQRAEKRTERKTVRRAELREERRAGMRAERRSTMQMRTREAESAEQRYYESLRTLHKTGLLTKDEMRDMLERHERSRARQRRR